MDYGRVLLQQAVAVAFRQVGQIWLLQPFLQFLSHARCALALRSRAQPFAIFLVICALSISLVHEVLEITT